MRIETRSSGEQTLAISSTELLSKITAGKQMQFHQIRKIHNPSGLQAPL